MNSEEKKKNIPLEWIAMWIARQDDDVVGFIKKSVGYQILVDWKKDCEDEEWMLKST